MCTMYYPCANLHQRQNEVICISVFITSFFGTSLYILCCVPTFYLLALLEYGLNVKFVLYTISTS